MHRFSRSCCCAFLAIAASASSSVAAAERSANALRSGMRDWADERLSERLDQLLSRDDFRRAAEYEACLSEIIRRGGSKWAGLLRKRFEALSFREFNTYGDDEDLEPGSHFNLELLTALRRVERQPDPLRIVVELADDEAESTPLSLPRLQVTIRNVDVEKRDAGFTFGGNYRSGRQARWRVWLRDAEGRAVSRRVQRGIITGGGLSQSGVLRHGESWQTVLDMRRFIMAPAPGRYSLQVLYHDTRTIADSDDRSGLIVCRSDPIPFIVEPVVIHLTDVERRAAMRWIAAIDAEKELKIVDGTYGEWAHEFISPRSPQGKLLGMDLKSIPPLVDALRQKELPVDKRAWIHSLLFSLTGEHDPRYESRLGDYESLEGPWEIRGGRPGEVSSGGIGFPSIMSSRGGELNGESQQELSEQWIDWAKTVTVTVAPAD